MTSVLPPPRGFRGPYLTDGRVCAAYSEGAGPYRIIPRAVAVPRDTEDVIRLVQAASAAGSPLIPRGSGSGMPGGNIGTGTVVDLQSMDRRVSFGDGQTVGVGAATLWGELDRLAASRGLRLPPDPSSGSFCTIGGMIATNAAGPRSFRYGSIRRWVRSLEMVTADGEILPLTRAAGHASAEGPHPAARRRFREAVAPAIARQAGNIRARFPQTTKNSAGYAIDEYLRSGDVLDLIIGSEGTLGIVTRADLALEQSPPASAAMLIAIEELAALGDTVAAVGEHRPVAVELVDRTLLELAGDRAPARLRDVEAILLVGFEASSDAEVRCTMEEATRSVSHTCQFLETAVAPREQRALWQIRRAASPALAALPDTRRSLQFIEDGCVPVAALGRYLRGVRNAAVATGIEIVAFGHAGDGHLHVNALVDTSKPDFAEKLARLFERVSDLVLELGGTPTGEHGDGRLRAHLLDRLYGSDVVMLFRQVKDAFDPEGVLNPGVILPNGASDPTSDLKVGQAAVGIPQGIAGGLRLVEQTGGWDRSKLELLEEGKYPLTGDRTPRQTERASSRQPP